MTLAGSNGELKAICEAVGLDASERQIGLLCAYLDLLRAWNRTFNLTSVRDREAMLTLHLADCLAVVPSLQRQPAKRLLDVGSGAGLPGLVFSVMLPDLEVSCVDAVGKKVAFLRQVKGHLRLERFQAVHARVEAMESAAFDIVCCRAFASLADFVALTSRQLAPGGLWLAMKGKQPLEEIAALPPRFEVFHVEQLMVPGLDAERCLVWMRQQGPASPQGSLTAAAEP